MTKGQGSSGPTRRHVVQSGAALAVTAAVPQHAQGATSRVLEQTAELSWLGGTPAKVDTELVWGTPWPRGALSASTKFQLTTQNGKSVPVQSWPLAYWPDGTLKWTGHAAGGPLDAETLLLSPGRSAQPADPITVREASGNIVLHSGELECVFPKSGAVLIQSVRNGNRNTNRKPALGGFSPGSQQAISGILRTEWFESRMESVVVEQSGPCALFCAFKASISSDGGVPGCRSRSVFVCMPADLAFGSCIRSSSMAKRRTILYPVWRLALTFLCATNCTIVMCVLRARIAGLWSEAVRNLPGWAPRFALASRFQDQLAGRPAPALSEMTEISRTQLATVPAWDDFKLFQSSADHFDVTKRTVPSASWLQADHGGRASGLGYVGGISGGVVFGVKDFWQRHPTALEINGATSERAKVTLWLWSPDAAPDGSSSLRRSWSRSGDSI